MRTGERGNPCAGVWPWVVERGVDVADWPIASIRCGAAIRSLSDQSGHRSEFMSTRPSAPDSKRGDLDRDFHPIEGVRRPVPYAGNRRGLLLLAGHGNGNMLVAGELVVGRIEAVPARSGNIDLRPCMGGAMLPFRHLDVPGDEACGKTPM